MKLSAEAVNNVKIRKYENVQMKYSSAFYLHIFTFAN